MLYTWSEEISIFTKHPEILTVSEFAKLTERQMCFVCLVADAKSPIKTLPERQRRERACYILQFPMEGTRLDKNGRNLVLGQVESVERAIETYKLNSYDEDADTLNALRTQIQEIKEYLKSDKSIPLTYKDKIVLDDKGKEKRYTDPKNLKLASELGEKLPGLVEAYKKIESILQVKEEKLSIPTYTASDLPPQQEGDEPLSMLDQWHVQQRKNEN